jgi:hypothetical protein
MEKGYQSFARCCIIGRPHPPAVGFVIAGTGRQVRCLSEDGHIFAYPQCTVQEHKHENRSQGISIWVEVACADQWLQERKRCRKRNT